MKNKFALLLGVMIAGMFSVQAQQQQRTVEERVKSIMTRITDSLGLSKEQVTATETVFTEYYTAQNKLREGLEPGARPDRAQMEKLTAERDEKLKKVFTEAQYKQFKEVLEPNMRRLRGDRPPGGQ